MGYILIYFVISEELKKDIVRYNLNSKILI